MHVIIRCAWRLDVIGNIIVLRMDAHGEQMDAEIRCALRIEMWRKAECELMYAEIICLRLIDVHRTDVLGD